MQSPLDLAYSQYTTTRLIFITTDFLTHDIVQCEVESKNVNRAKEKTKIYQLVKAIRSHVLYYLSEARVSWREKCTADILACNRAYEGLIL